MRNVFRKKPSYSVNERKLRTQRRFWYLLPITIIVIGAAIVGYRLLLPAEATVEKTIEKLQFDKSVSDSEKKQIATAIQANNLRVKGRVDVSVDTTLKGDTYAQVTRAYVPVTSTYSSFQSVTTEQLSSYKLYASKNIDEVEVQALAKAINIDQTSINSFENASQLGRMDVAFIPVEELSSGYKLLSFNESYYLDAYSSGAVYRTASFSNGNAKELSTATLNDLPTKESVLKINQTGVTALTRLMMRKLNQVGDPLYFSKKIGDYLADADITHVSNESSFQDGCAYSNTVLCSDPRFIETLKDSGVDVVELTGNHNNDVGSQYNTETIELYKSLGWKTFGGGLNSTEAALPYITDAKSSKIAFLGYNYADSPSGGAIATSTKAGANSYDEAKVKADIEKAKQQAKFVIVDVQFWECYAYPAGYIEFPECDSPIGDQKKVFRQLVDFGADMVVGTQAHQPQTFELYNGKPIYYGLGNLYFDQYQWPGTERGIILTHYFRKGTLLQTKLTPTEYDADLQTRLASDEETEYLLDRLHEARQLL